MFNILVQNFHLEKIIWSIKSKVKYMILVGLIFAMCSGVYASVTSSSTYVANVTFYVYSNPEYMNDTGVNISSTEITQAYNLLESYMQIIYSKSFLNSVLEEAQLENRYTTEMLKRRISAKTVEKTSVFSVYVYDADPIVAMNIANAIGTLAPDKIIEVVKSGGIEVLDPAEMPTEPYESTSVIKSALLGGIVGALLVAVIALCWGMFNTIIRRKYEIEDLFTIPIIGDVPLLNDSADKKGEKKSFLSEKSPFILKEAYSGIRANLLYKGREEKCPVFAVTSADDNEGKTVNAYNMALSYAMLDKKVLLINADMRKRGLDKYFTVEKKNKLGDYLSGNINTIEAYKETDKLDVICAGDKINNPAELLGSESWKLLIKSNKQKYDAIFIDLPSLGSVSDALFVSEDVTGYILVVCENQTRFERVEMIVQKLEAVNAKICGFIYNEISTKSPDYVYKNYEKRAK